LIITVAAKYTLATKSPHWHRLETTKYANVAGVAGVAGVF
jgi:hypothetical protein